MATTVVIPCYNHGHWLADAISSSVSQAEEVIVVDDGSTDNSPEVAHSFPVRYHRQPNAGLAAARNAGLGLTKTDLVCFLDSDDSLPANFIEETTRALDGQQADVAFAYSGIQFAGDDHRYFPTETWSLSRLKNDNYVSATSLFRVKAIGGTRFDSALRGWEDWDFALALAERGLTGVPANCFFEYRKHWDQPSMFDLLGQRSINAAQARRHIVRKHRALYTPSEILKAEAAVHAARARDLKLRLRE